MTFRDEYENKMQAQLDEWRTKFEALKEKATQEETNLQLEYYTLIDEMKIELGVAHEKLEQLKDTSDEAWEEIKKEVEITWDSLHDLIKSLTLP